MPCPLSRCFLTPEDSCNYYNHHTVEHIRMLEIIIYAQTRIFQMYGLVAPWNCLLLISMLFTSCVCSLWPTSEHFKSWLFTIGHPLRSLKIILKFLKKFWSLKFCLLSTCHLYLIKKKMGIKFTNPSLHSTPPPC